jgi:N-acyl amino acid synthase of PEP-CTERM/exosortase system
MLHTHVTEREPLPPVIASGISEIYHQWFEVLPADTPALLEEVYRLRYKVYCLENPFENPADHAQHLEMDTFDRRSIHSLIVDRSSGSGIGTVRLIRPEMGTNNISLPIQQICHHSLLTTMCLKNSAEISRFAISKKMRGMVNGELPKELKCSVILGLMRAIVQMSLELGITEWFAVMEPSLLRLLSRFGIHFGTLGPLISYHGMRQPCHANVHNLLATIRNEQNELWEFVVKSIAPWRTEKAC